MSATTSTQSNPFPCSTLEDSMPSTSKSSQSPQVDEETSTHNPSAMTAPPSPNKPPHRKQPIRDFVWGGDFVRKALPTPTLPRWLDPYHVDADLKELPLCWFGVPFVRKLIYPYTERVGLASYYTRQVLRAKPGDLDTFQTCANVDVWFKRESGLQLDLNLVWGEPTPILTFFSNLESSNITKDQIVMICALLDDMDYDEDYQLMWYLDRNLDY